MPNKPTYAEIGAIANVSAATVSRVLNNSVPVKDATRRKVLMALERSGVNTTALKAKNPASNTGLPIILNVPSIASPFHSEIARGAKLCAAQRGYHLLINEDEINTETLNELILLIKNIKVAGIIVVNYMSAELVARLHSILPLVQCCEVSSYDTPYVTINDVQAAKRVVDYLFSIGRKRIAVITGPSTHKYAVGRLEGYITSLNANKAELDNNLILQLPDPSFDKAVPAVTALLESPKRPDAIFASSDVLAAGALKAAAKAGLRVPEDVAIAGFDNVDISLMTNPTITTVNQPGFSMGYACCNILVEQINGADIMPKSVTMDVEMIVRESTAISPGSNHMGETGVQATPGR